ncbi:ficolin-2-like [Pecten maximus]|uniref:ficolin-2-like n=1 Tax=Pecten maximus TaxID=6579 RepID=UPI0014586162|nr:ficolin-2-like [Pecten maximus]
MDTAGGPWTIFARRYDGSVDFFRTWKGYRNGFGYLLGEFWLGFENLRLLLAQDMLLRIEMEGWTTGLKYAEYSTFYISDEASKYALTIGGFSSPDGLFDALKYHNNRCFTTFDNVNSGFSRDCTTDAHGAWWYGACLDSNLFGMYKQEDDYNAMVWEYFYSTDTRYTAVRTVVMMLRKA